MKSIKRPFVFIIFGPTAVGKTDFALTIADHIPSEIVNMDVGQFYAPLSIGTAKPDWRSNHTPHHLFDIIKEPRSLTAIEYRAALLDTVESIWQKRRLPIIVGGSTFYLKSIFFPPCARTKGINIEEFYPEHVDLWQKLFEIDPTRARQIDKNDRYRVRRALEIWHETGKLPSSFIPQYKPPADFLLLFLTRERQELYKRINLRVLQMIEQGWIDEVRQLRGTPWEQFIHKKKIIGYAELFDYLISENKQELLHVTKRIQQKTRNYAKRQQTFWNMLEKEFKYTAVHDNHFVGCLESANLTFGGLHLYINELLERLSVLFI